LDLVGRLGRAYYTRASGDAIFTVAQSQTDICIGFDALPQVIKDSKVLTGNNIGYLSGLLELPDKEAVLELPNTNAHVAKICAEDGNQTHALQNYAKALLDAGDFQLGVEVAFLSAWR
jgi:hypothetical protein